MTNTKAKSTKSPLFSPPVLPFFVVSDSSSLCAMAAISPNLTTTPPSLPSLRSPRPRLLQPTTFAASVLPPRVVLRGFRRADPLSGNFLWPVNMVCLYWEQEKQVAFASETNPSSTDRVEKNSTADGKSSSSDGPPLLTILAGITMFLLICWVVGSFVTWLIGLIFSAVRS